MILLENVSKEYKNGVHALRDINLAIDDGEFVYIIGPTGSGKSHISIPPKGGYFTYLPSSSA